MFNVQYSEYVPVEMVNFLLVILFSLLIGLSIHRLNLNKESERFLFGTDRTFTFIGILGYLLYILDPVEYRLYILGAVILGVLFAINYFIKQLKYQLFGVTTIVIALITYALPPIVVTQPSWLYIMVVVAVLLFMEMKHNFAELAQKMKNDEMVTLAKFLAISGIILPILPNENLLPEINLTPYTVWLATVVVSGISYLSYLLKRYVFQESGTLVSGIIGGLYSSTATISVLARKGKETTGAEAEECVAAMLMAVSMMFLRFLVLIGIFSRETLMIIWPYMLVMSAVAFLVGIRVHMKNRQQLAKDVSSRNDTDSSNPLEFKVALIFAVLFVVFTLVTHYTLVYAGNSGLHVLSFISGLSDITPFILNLLESTGSIQVDVVAACSMQAIISNICVNMCYALFFSGGNKSMKPLILRGFGIVIAVNILVLVALYML
ncbi:MAG: DUF4010 domain-containing protein [Bacteroidaceae bacterium]|nr:DUF4010 domain-containing protein [Bacteroidaceae bacterium]MBR1541660.1 DUF4010 domain-containing protein [Bacteroidaceae bacterium]